MAQFFLDHLAGERVGAEERFDGELVRVGRNDDSDLLFDEKGVSWEHAELRLREGDWWVVDQGSTNGTYVNDERAHNARIKDGDVVRFGKKGPMVRFRLKARPGSDSLPVTSSASRAGRRRKPRVPSEAEVPIPNLDDLGPEFSPDQRHSNLPAAGVLIAGGRGGLGALLTLAALCLGSFALLALLYVNYETQGADLQRLRSELDERSGAYATLEGEVGALVAAAREDGRLEALRQARQGRDVLRRQVAALEQQLLDARREAGDASRRVALVEQQLGTLRGALEAARARAGAAEVAPTASWDEIAQRLTRSVVLIATEVEGRQADGTRVPLRTFGAGFFISSQGHIATPKHVVQPWKFRAMAERLAQEGIEVVEGSWVVHAWPGGVRFRAADGELDLSAAFSTTRHTLELVRTAPDRWVDLTLGGDGARLVRVHQASGNEDLALLRARTPRAYPIPIGRSDSVAQLDDVLVLGFPAGPAIMKAGVTAPSPTLSDVRRVDQAIYVSTPLQGVSSGGPLVNRQGRVVGMATRPVEGATLGACLKIEHAIQLLHGGPW